MATTTTTSGTTTFTTSVSAPRYRAAKTITQVDVWGLIEHGEKSVERRTNGYIIAFPGDTCPHFKDQVPSKAVTILVPKSIFIDAETLMDVFYWLEYVQGAGCIEKTDTDDQGNLAVRANYMCW